MIRTKLPLSLLAVFILVNYVRGTAYSSGSCASTCAAGDFIEELSDEFIDNGENRAYFWSAVAMLQLAANIEDQSPPGAGRVAAIVGTCIYEAAAMNTKKYKSSLGSSYSFRVSGGEDILTATLDGAGFWAVREIFGERGSFNDVFRLYSQVGNLNLRELEEKMRPGHGHSFKSHTSSKHPSDLGRMAAAQVGAEACKAVVDRFTADGFEPDGILRGVSDPTNYTPVNTPQRLAGITDCDNEIVDPGAWQPLCVPSSSADFGTTRCTAQTFLGPFAGRFTTFALQDGDEMTGNALSAPPPEPGSQQFESEWREILDISSKLDDVEKIIAEYWADGPDTTTPPGHWYKIAMDAAIDEDLDQTETARLLFIVGNAVNDAGIASWRTKFTFNFIRPLQMIQCGAYRGRTMTAWRGPYMGVGPSNVSEWRPYQASDFVTPPFAAYTSGHSTFSAAAAEALALFFGDDTYRGPPCFRTKEGESLFEPRSNDMPGFSDIPNTGFNTIGYTPREDVVLCWDTYTDAAAEAGRSRFYGGIHVEADDVSGQSLGRKVGRDVFSKATVLFR